MEDNTPLDSNAGEMVADSGKVGVSLRENLIQHFDKKDEDNRSVPTQIKQEEPHESIPKQTTDEKVAQVAATQERVAIAPPADMNKAEKEAFLNPTSENAHVLQSYLSRRAYQYRTDYQKQTAELEQTRQKVNSLYNTIKDFEPEYIKQGISLSDVARRSIEWDRAMKQNPVETAMEWLEAYGVNLNELSDYYQKNHSTPQQPSNYLTKEEAETIAQQKIEAMINEQRQSALAYTNHQTVQSFIQSKPLFKDPGTAAQLEDAMAPVVAALSQQGGSPQEILETAYNYVTKGHPTFSALAQKLDVPQVVERKVAEAQKAKAAIRSITGSAGSGTPRLKTKSLGENLRRRYSGE